MTDRAEEQRTRRESFGWQLAVAVFVALGCLATAGYTIVENFWG